MTSLTKQSQYDFRDRDNILLKNNQNYVFECFGVKTVKWNICNTQYGYLVCKTLKYFLSKV